MSMNMKAGPLTFKLVLLGDGRVGKTSLVLRYVNNIFSEQQTATVQASYLTKRLNINGVVVTLSIWDTAGQERFHALGPIYYRDADAALLVYDIMDKDSFTRVTNWVKELRQMASKNIILAIAANKSDVEQEMTTMQEDGSVVQAALGLSNSGKQMDQTGKKKYVKQVTGRHNDTELHLAVKNGDYKNSKWTECSYMGCHCKNSNMQADLKLNRLQIKTLQTKN